MSNLGVTFKDIQAAEEVVDPRLSVSSRPNQCQLEEGLSSQLPEVFLGTGQTTHQSSLADPEKTGSTAAEAEPIYVEFQQGDTRDPGNFSYCKKWLMTLTACVFTGLTSSTAGSYTLGFTSMMSDLGCTRFQAVLGLSLYALGFGVVPLVTASFSEEFGRRPLYIGSMIGFSAMHIMIGLAPNVQVVLAGRFFQGAFGSTGATMVGGTIADLWMPAERSLPMSVFAIGGVTGSALGPVIAGWIESDSRFQWRWIQWFHLIVAGVVTIGVYFIMQETRTAILLTRIARKTRKETGNFRYRARAEDESASLRNLIFVSCTRPLHLLVTEPVVASFSLWVGFAWGVFYCMLSSISPVFHNLHFFTTGQTGTAYTGMVIGTLLGFGTNFYQERLYKKNVLSRGPEARLYMACVAALLLPIGMLIYAWSSFPWVHWMALEVGITIFTWGMFIVYLAVFTYLADTYGPFASSALAGQSLCRNLMATAFPLFTDRMYDTLSYKWANTMFGCIAAVMIPIPYMLFFYGPRIRAKSKFSRMVLESQKS